MQVSPNALAFYLSSQCMNFARCTDRSTSRLFYGLSPWLLRYHWAERDQEMQGKQVRDCFKYYCPCYIFNNKLFKFTAICTVTTFGTSVPLALSNLPNESKFPTPMKLPEIRYFYILNSGWTFIDLSGETEKYICWSFIALMPRLTSV